MSQLRPGEVRSVHGRAHAIAELLLPGRVWLVMAVCSVPATLLAAVNLSPLMSSWTVARLVDLNAEGNVAVWFSAFMLLAIALVAFACAAHEHLSGNDRLASRGWLLISALFAALSMDEVASVHELVGELTSSRVTRMEGLPGLYIWVLALAPLWLGLLWTLGRWFWTLGCTRVTSRLAFAALGLWLLVPAFEVLDPQLGAPRWLIVAEESAEMLGQILMLGSLLAHLAYLARQRPMSLVVHGPEPAADRGIAGSEAQETTAEARRVTPRRRAA